MADPVRSPFSRVFTIEDRAGPANIPTYQGQARAMGPSWAFGDRTPIREPDPSRYGAFNIIDAIKAERELPNMSIENRYQYTISAFLELARRGCPFDVQVHFGKCQDPRDFNGGWDKVLVLEAADISNWSTNELGALEQGQDALVNETIDMNGFDMFEIKRLGFSSLAAAEVVQEVFDIVICDAISCGVCGIPSTGCQTIFAIQTAAGGSPGLPSELIYSQDGGSTIGETNITSLGPTEEPDALACVGVYVVVVSEDSCSIHYALAADILSGTETWAENASGIVSPTGCPRDIFSAGSANTWVVGLGGYIYFYSDVTAAAIVQTSALVGNLNAIHGSDDQNLVAVGASNAVLRTENGGETWSVITGPAVGVDLNAVWVRSADEWFIGANNGRLWYTRDGGETWTEKSFPGSGTGVVRDISFATPTVGYLAHDTVAPAGRILRTIDGGSSWYVMPEGTGSIPTNQRINALASCGEDVNILYGAGLGVATDGIIVKAA